jgi:hypothetical protein
LPKFPSENKVQTMTRREKDTAALLCPAQASPVPVFRFGEMFLFLIITSSMKPFKQFKMQNQ